MPAKEARQQRDQLEAITDYVQQREQSNQVEKELKTVSIKTTLKVIDGKLIAGQKIHRHWKDLQANLNHGKKIINLLMEQL